MDPREMLSPGVQVEIEERGQKRIFTTIAEARDFVLGRPLGLVLKADGLAAGKGVFVCDNLRQALEGRSTRSWCLAASSARPAIA